MVRARVKRVLVRRVAPGSVSMVADELIVEEPLEIRLDGELVATTMRTPGHDFELAVGWCHAEGLLDGTTVRSVRYCATGSPVDTEFNVVTVETTRAAPLVVDARLSSSTSSCGLCGSRHIETLTSRLCPIDAGPPIDTDLLASIPDEVRGRQVLFGRTGAVHAAAVFDAEGRVLLVREDIGRHNAVDKVVGRLRLDDTLGVRGGGLYVSGRASFEMVQKAWAAGFGTIVAVSAPSALAVQVATAAGITLAGFVRPGGLNLYSGAGVDVAVTS